MGGSEKCWDCPFNIVTASTNNLFQIILGWGQILIDKKIPRLKDSKCQQFPGLQTEVLISKLFSQKSITEFIFLFWIILRSPSSDRVRGRSIFMRYDTGGGGGVCP